MLGNAHWQLDPLASRECVVARLQIARILGGSRRESDVNPESFQIDPRIGMAHELEGVLPAREALLRVQRDAQQHRKIVDKEGFRPQMFAIQKNIDIAQADGLLPNIVDACTSK